MFKEHKVEVKSWRKDLGEANRKHIKLEKKFEKLEAPKYSADEIHAKLVNSEPDEVPFDSLDEICNICALPIKDFVPNYFMGEKVNPACSHCKDDNYDDPFFLAVLPQTFPPH